jgi:hypothetical protein
LQADVAHQPRHRAASDGLALALQLSPHFAHSVDLKVLVEDAPDVPAKDGVAPNPGWRGVGIAPARGLLVIG